MALADRSAIDFKIEKNLLLSSNFVMNTGFANYDSEIAN